MGELTSGHLERDFVENTFLTPKGNSSISLERSGIMSRIGYFPVHVHHLNENICFSFFVHQMHMGICFRTFPFFCLCRKLTLMPVPLVHLSVAPEQNISPQSWTLLQQTEKYWCVGKNNIYSKKSAGFQLQASSPFFYMTPAHSQKQPTTAARPHEDPQWLNVNKSDYCDKKTEYSFMIMWGLTTHFTVRSDRLNW